MYQKEFTPQARGALRMAQKAAQELGHSYVGSEHLLLGLLRQGDDYLAQQHVTAERVREVIVSVVGEGQAGLAPTQGLTERARGAIGTAAGECARRGGTSVDTEDLLLGLLRERGAMSNRVLQGVGADPEKLQTALVQRMNGRSGGRESAPRPPERREELPRSRTLEQYTRSLNALARAGKLDPVIGRETEIRRAICILSRRSKNNPVLIGEPGVGKTAIAEGLAQRLVEGDVPEPLRGMTILDLDLTAMLAGTKYRGEFEERVKSVLAEIRRMGSVIVFIDEVHTLVGSGSAEGSVDAANILKPALSRGEIRVIGATTLEEYRRYIEKDAALARRFQPLTVAEPTRETALTILQELCPRYERHHHLAIGFEALSAAVELSQRYLTDRFLPDKAIDLVDEACSRVRLEGGDMPDLRHLEKRLEQVRRDKEQAAAREDFELAAKLRDAEEDFDRQLREEKMRWQTGSRAVTREDVAAVVSEWTGIPLQGITQDEGERLLGLEEALKATVVGQNRAVEAVARAIRRSRVGLKEEGRPAGSFLLLGPSGVGKTQLCRTLARNLFGREDAMVRIDMSEYAESHAASRLVGAPPGYVGHEEGGQLTEPVRRRPYSLVLFDEVEKAHSQVWNLLLQVMEDGVLTDSHGRRVDFRNTILVMTSNVGAEETAGGKGPLGFSAEKAGEDRNFRAVEAALKQTFRPEFLNRIDETVVFNRLGQEELAEIARRMLLDLASRTEKLGLSLAWEEDVPGDLARRGFDRAYGARPIRRLIRREVEDPIAQGLLSGRFASGSRLRLRAGEKSLAIEGEA